LECWKIHCLNGESHSYEGHGRHTHIGKLFGIGVVGLGEGKGLVRGLQGHPELKVRAICDVAQV